MTGITPFCQRIPGAETIKAKYSFQSPLKSPSLPAGKEGLGCGGSNHRSDGRLSGAIGTASLKSRITTSSPHWHGPISSLSKITFIPVASFH